jgi:hypothetical protein
LMIQLLPAYIWQKTPQYQEIWVPILDNEDQHDWSSFIHT